MDGESEFASLPLLLPRIQTRHTLLRVLWAQVHPLGELGKQVRALIPPIRTLAEKRRADLVVVVLDREQRALCSGALSSELRTALRAECASQGVRVDVEVVVKDRMFENWLVADLDALRSMPKRFTVSQAFANQVEPDRADRADAPRLLSNAVRKGPYDKVEDAKRIMGAAAPLGIGANSRSFRRFLRVLGNPVYRRQSRRPAGQ